MIKTIEPSSPILRKYVGCFYFYEGKANSSFSYLAFPHFNTGLSFMKGASVQRQNWTLHVSENRTDSVHIEILGKYTTPVFLEYKGTLREISVIFKPLGINRFFKDNYLSLAPHFSQELINDVWRKLGETLFSGDDDISKIESFLLSQFNDHPEFSTIDKALTLIENSDEKMAISTIPKTFSNQRAKWMEIRLFGKLNSVLKVQF